MDPIFFGFSLFLHDLVHLLGEFENLGFKFDVLLDHLLAVGTILVSLFAGSAFFDGSFWGVNEVFLIILLLGMHFFLGFCYGFCLCLYVDCE